MYQSETQIGATVDHSPGCLDRSLVSRSRPQWPPLRVYFGITIILSILGWTGLARVRGNLLELCSGDFVVAARSAAPPAAR